MLNAECRMLNESVKAELATASSEQLAASG